MKKFILSMFVMVSFGLYVISQNTGNNSSNNPIAPIVVSKNITPVKKKPIAVAIVPPATPPVSTPAPTPVIPAPVKNGIYNDGTYIGNSANAYYGNVQVQVAITNGRITDVKFLDYPQGARNSARINAQAMPILAQEAISAQSANVNGVSGASETSSAFIQSLTSALSQAIA
jgi:uncharacterized protein with FMN-binding domain